MHPSPRAPARTHQPSRPRVPRRLSAALTAVALTGAALLTGPTAYAHDQLVDSSPEAGDHLDEPPTEVRLSYSGELLTLGAAVIVADAAGEPWQDGDPVLDGAEVVVPLRPDLPDGAYEVRWRVVSSDGHPIAGVVPFTVGDPAAAPVAAAPAQAGAPVPDETSGSSARVIVLGVLGAAVALGLYAVTTLLRRRSPGRGGTNSPLPS